MPNTLTAQSLFLNSPDYLERYQIALTNVSGSFNEIASSSVFFDAQVKPSLIDDKAVRFYVYKRMLSEMIVFNPYVKLNVAKLGMSDAVFGETPKLVLFVNNEGKLNPISESDILQAVIHQFNDDNLLAQLLNQNILKVTAVFNN
ncbi:MAG: hypothetical protein PX635_15280 [Nostocales cyanobacterium LE14-WE12]|jgi:hypothetical protein|nr:hypothetical protein [Nostocales cyanobacterium LE14-WE12]